MFYADTDFFLALLKEDDWLADSARKLLQEKRGEITTSVVTITELLLLSKRFSLDPESLLSAVFGICPSVEGITPSMALAAAHLMKEDGLNVFDALHASFCQERQIISSDKVFDKIGMKRIRLENHR